MPEELCRSRRQQMMWFVLLYAVADLPLPKKSYSKGSEDVENATNVII